jgi:5'-methylthioadenosine phosphorylase
MRFFRKELINDASEGLLWCEMIGIIGGSGLDDPKILKNAKDLEVETKFGKPSSPLKIGEISGKKVCFIARHGRKHTIPPTQVDFRANIQAMKDQGVTQIIATTACGSLRKEIGRGDFVVLDQFIDFTRHRQVTYYEEFEAGNAKHVAMPDPFAEGLRKILIGACKEIKQKVHSKGTVITIEGPRFSTRAESKMFRIWGADVINMSIAPECILANEAGIEYAAIAMSTDYDSWAEDEAPVEWEEILRVFKENAEKVKTVLVKAVESIGKD